MVVVMTKCFVVTGGGRYKAVIDVVVVSIVKPGAYVAGIWMEAFPSDVDGCVPSSNEIDLRELISHPPGDTGTFHVIANV